MQSSTITTRRQQRGSFQSGPIRGIVRGAVCGTDREQRIDDATLLQRIARQDEDAFRIFYRRYGGRVAGLLRQLCAETVIAEDALQEVFIAVWRRAGTFDSRRGKASGWLYAIARNKAFDDHRRRARSLPLAQDTPLDQPAPASHKELRISLEQAIDSLEQNEREAVRLAYFGGLTYRETAEHLELPLGTLKSRIRTGLRKLHNFMK